MDIVFVHGWGSAPFVWKDILPHFEKNYDCHTINMGFLGDEDFTMPEGKFIGIGHSLGGLWLLKHYPEQMIGFISVASFNCFYKYIPEQILDSMKRNMVQNSVDQVKEFWHHAGLDQSGGFKNLKPAKLIEGLSWLSKWDAETPNGLPVMVLASRNDHIVPRRMTEKIWGEYPIKWIDTGGHMLPITQSEWCTEHIKSFINEYE